MISNLEQTLRWFGPTDPVNLQAIAQTGATGIVTALQHIPIGEEWRSKEIEKRKALIENAGLRWAVVENLNLHESIRIAGAQRDDYIDKYIATLKNLSRAGLDIVGYNFMPVLNSTRTNLNYRLPNNATALRYDAVALAAFDLYVLERPEAYKEFGNEQQRKAKLYFDTLNADQILELTKAIMAGLPGTEDVSTIEDFKNHLKKYEHIDAKLLKKNLSYFLKAIMPEAEKAGVKMCLHPDDPPFSVLGLPRIVSTEHDLVDILNAYPSRSNGLTFCTGSLGANPANDLPGIVSRLGKYIHFLYLRNVQREPNGSFYEADHLNGSIDMHAVMQSIILEQKKRRDSGRKDIAIPMQPDHGHKLLDDNNYDTHPGYSIIGRLKGLAELRGLEMGIKRTLFEF